MRSSRRSKSPGREPGLQELSEGYAVKNTRKKRAKANVSPRAVKTLVQWLVKWLPRPAKSGATTNSRTVNRNLARKWNRRREKILDWSTEFRPSRKRLREKLRPNPLLRSLRETATLVEFHFNVLDFRSTPNISDSEAQVYFMALAAVGRVTGRAEWGFVADAITCAYVNRGEKIGIQQKALWERLRPFFEGRKKLVTAEKHLPHELRIRIPDIH